MHYYKNTGFPRCFFLSFYKVEIILAVFLLYQLSVGHFVIAAILKENPGKFSV